MKIELIHPENDSVSHPLQKAHWPEDHDPMDEISNDLGAIEWLNLRAEGEDLSLPEPVRFEWRAQGQLPDNVTFEMRISNDPDLKQHRSFPQLQEKHVHVSHLHIDCRYYWQVLTSNGNGCDIASDVSSFVTHSAPPRWIAAPGITNVRDLGGWRLHNGRCYRQGQLYRSSEMNSHICINETGRRVLVEELGIRTDLDLRQHPEEIGPVLDESKVTYINIPVLPYDHVSDPDIGEAYRSAFEVLANADRYPILFHCWGGADRAGTLALLIGGLLGMRRKDLIMDYELTSLSIWGIRSRHSESFVSLLEELRQFSDQDCLNAQVEAYLSSIGVTASQMTAIRNQLID